MSDRVRPTIHPSIGACVGHGLGETHPSTHASTHPSTHASTHPSTHASTHPSREDDVTMTTMTMTMGEGGITRLDVRIQ